MKLSEIQSVTRSVTVSFQGETIDVDYRANIITPAFLSDKPDVTEQVKRAVIRWNIVDDAGEEIPVKDVADQLPVALLVEVITAITDDIRLASTEKNA